MVAKVESIVVIKHQFPIHLPVILMDTQVFCELLALKLDAVFTFGLSDGMIWRFYEGVDELRK